METILKEVQAIRSDIETLSANLSENKQDAQRGLNKLSILDDCDKLESVISYLVDAVNDMDRMRDALKTSMDDLNRLSDDIGFEMLSQLVRKVN